MKIAKTHILLVSIKLPRWLDPGNVFIDDSDTGPNSLNHGEIDMKNSSEGEKTIVGVSRITHYAGKLETNRII